MEVKEEYIASAKTGAHSDRSVQPRAPFWEQVEALRASGDIAMFLSVSNRPDVDFRLTLANGQSVLIDRKALRWYARNELRDEEDPRSAFVLLMARKIFRACGGKKALGISFRDWMRKR